MTWIEWFWAFLFTQNPWLLPVLVTFGVCIILSYYVYARIMQLRRVIMLRLPPVPERFSELDEIDDQRRQLVEIEKLVRDRQAKMKKPQPRPQPRGARRR